MTLPAPQSPPELSVIIPTYNERGNIRPLVASIGAALDGAGVTWEIIFVDDDSPDRTGERIAEIAREDRRVRSLRRIGRRGLSGACIDGLASSNSAFLAVMDADLQHDERLLPAMLHELKSRQLELIIGSRYIEGGGVGEWTPRRRRLSRLATAITQKLTRCTVADPMSGFFMIRREVFAEIAPRLSGQGFKILLDLIASARRPLRTAELPFHFRLRRTGESKLDSNVALEFVFLLADKLFGPWLPVRFLVFSMIGGSGVVLHMGVLAALYKLAQTPFATAQAAATGVAMVYNFFLNNQITFRTNQLKGKRLAAGLLVFVAVCSIGAVTNVQVAKYLYVSGLPWWMAGAAGIVIVSVWNFGVTSQLVWKRRRP